MKKCIIILLLVAASCSPNKDKASFDGKNITHQIIGKYIVFSDPAFHENLKFAIYAKTDSTEFSKYGKQKCLFENFKMNPIHFIDIKQDVLLIDRGASPDPHDIDFIDLNSGKSILPDTFSYLTDQYKMKDEYILMKFIGKKMIGEKTALLDKKAFAAVLEEQKKVRSLGGIGYYELFNFNLEKKELKPANRIIPVLLH